MARKFNVAVVGATGAVGTCMLRLLEERNFPVNEIRPLASSRSINKKVRFCDQEIPVRELTHDAFKNIEIALFSAGAGRSKEFAPSAVKAGAVVIDNTSQFRMDPEVPLVVPEVNPQDIKKHKGIIANPNCSTIQMVVALKPLHDYATIKRVVVSTYQSVSGAGQSAINELCNQAKQFVDGDDLVVEKFQHQIVFNLIPHIDVFLDNYYTKEEMKMVHETKKIMGDDSIQVTSTCVRVPVFYAHSESVNVETERKITREKAIELLSKAPGIKVIDDVHTNKYPMPWDAGGLDATYVGRIREDESIANGLNLWVVADNLRKGAALNAIQIAELL
ncbi:MAG: aspartate-semialdehyde dehydrogenase [Candidatus Omnitrophica bacterium]|nr:aspartate-semialdehyde dehydrogenase [Candidatus Omnitrophota bacterium]